MGCCESIILKNTQFSATKSRTEFQIPDIVIDEYISRENLNINNTNSTDAEDYIWLTDINQLPSQWFVHNCDRNTADYLLRDKPDGTFLVRESRRQEGQYVLAVSLHYFVYQMIICKSVDGFGLLEPGVHPTLSSLISHYRQVSLETKNQILDTKLINGVFEKDNQYL